MSKVTDPLRERVLRLVELGYVEREPMLIQTLSACADQIDREVEERYIELPKDADECTRMAGVEDEFETVWITKSALLKDLDAIEREVESNYIELPKDADGMTVLPSDSMVDSNGEQFTVSSIELLASGDWLVYGSGRLGSKSAKLCHHHKSHTVEDVLRVFASHVRNDAMKFERISDETIAEYAQKLRLANNEE